MILSDKMRLLGIGCDPKNEEEREAQYFKLQGKPKKLMQLEAKLTKLRDSQATGQAPDAQPETLPGTPPLQTPPLDPSSAASLNAPEVEGLVEPLE